MEKVRVVEKFELFNEKWSPKIIAQVNDAYVKIAKIEGEFDWHMHEKEDELFYLVKGEMDLQFRNHTVSLLPGELVVVPKGEEHRPVAKDEAWIMMVEKDTTMNTGNVVTEKTKTELDWI